MKNCNFCNIEFEPKHLTRGNEQLYCSHSCRSKYYHQKGLAKKIQNALERQDNETTKTREAPTEVRTYSKQLNTDFNAFRSPNFDVSIELIEKKFEAKHEALEYKLRYEQCMKEIEIIRTENAMLKTELEDMDDQDDQEPGIMGMISGLAEKNPMLFDGIGLLMKNEKVRNYIISLVPE